MRDRRADRLRARPHGGRLVGHEAERFHLVASRSGCATASGNGQEPEAKLGSGTPSRQRPFDDGTGLRLAQGLGGGAAAVMNRRICVACAVVCPIRLVTTQA